MTPLKTFLLIMYTLAKLSKNEEIGDNDYETANYLQTMTTIEFHLRPHVEDLPSYLKDTTDNPLS